MVRSRFKFNFPLLVELNVEGKNIITIDDYITYVRTDDKWAVYYKDKDSGNPNKNPIVSSFGALRPISINKLSEILDCKVRRITRSSYNTWFALAKDGMLFIGGVSYHGCGNWMVQFESNKNGNWILTKYFPNIVRLQEFYPEPDMLAALVPISRESKGRTLNDYIVDYFKIKKSIPEMKRNALIQKLKQFMYHRIKDLVSNKTTIVYENVKGGTKKQLKAEESVAPRLTTEEAVLVDNDMVVNYMKDQVSNADVMNYVNNQSVNVDSFFEDDK